MTDQDENQADLDQSRTTWSEPGSAMAATGKVIDSRTLFKLQTEREERLVMHAAQAEARRHFMKMQLRVLSGVGLIFIATILTLVIGLWRHLIPLAFGTELMRMVIPTVLGAGLTIVGTFFHNGGGSKG